MAQSEPKQSWKGSVNDKGEYVRKDSVFRDWVKADGSSPFAPERDRYHLYVSLACPWAHRCLTVLALKGLEEVISVNVVDWLLQENGWKFNPERPGCTPDTVNNCQYMREVYKIANPDYKGNITVPCLWDKKLKTIVSNESSEIIRMLTREFNEFCTTKEQACLDLYPEALRAKIDEVNTWVYSDVNNGVYKSGFAKSQSAYDEAVTKLFTALDKIEDILSKNRYLTGSQLTEADIRLFTTLIRFDLVYVGHFKCNKKRIVDYPNMWGFVREIYQLPGVAATVDTVHIRYHYQASHLSINPTGIVAIQPDLDYNAPHGRENIGS